MPDEYILRDYLKSGENLAAQLQAFARQHPGLDVGIITPREEYMRQFLQELPDE